MKYFTVIIILLSPLIACGQNEMSFKVNLLDSMQNYYPLDYLYLEMFFKNNSQQDLEYHPLQLSKNLFNEGALRISVKNHSKTEIQKAVAFGNEDYYEIIKLPKGERVKSKGVFYPLCGDKPCFIDAGRYTIIIEYFPVYGKNGYQTKNNLVFKDSFEVKINPYLGKDQKAFEFLLENVPYKLLKTILSKKYTDPTKDIGYLFFSYPELVPIYETFVERFPNSSFTPWVMIRLVYAYLFNPYYSKIIEGSPDFQKSYTFLNKMEDYEESKTNKNLKSLIVQGYYEIKRTQKLFNR